MSSTATGGYDLKLGELIGELKSANRMLDEMKESAKTRQASHESRMKDIELRLSKLEINWIKLVLFAILISGLGAALPKGWEYLIKIF